MLVIANSSNSRTQWAIIDGARIVEQAETSGLNPFFLSRREISHIIRLELPEAFFRRRWDHVYFYGTGCSNPEKKKIVQSSLIAQFKTPTTVESNLLGAARGMLGHNPGLVCILSTGANSCFYNGSDIEHHVRSGGYVLGDEGSNSYLGKSLVSDILKGITPPHLISKFYGRFDTDADEVMDLVYTHPQASRTLAAYSDFLAENISDPYCEKMVYDGFMSFFRRNIAYYDYKNIPLSFVGSTCCTYRAIAEKAAADFGITIDRIELSAFDGIIRYHSV